jgi:peptidoglycan/LPS O-acetylase OafA/YrhL
MKPDILSDQSSIQRYRLIDFSRSLAALAVLALHYDRFIIKADWGNNLPGGGYETPLNTLLGPVYVHGEYAVPFFWMISGFIFSFVYHAQQVSFWNFSVRRFARLYPLHFMTLFLVAMLQLLLFLQIATNLFIPNNDLYHFVLNIFFVSAWGFEEGLSFNGPIWSVSVELIIYICFWLFIMYVPFRLMSAAILTGVCAVLTREGILPIMTLCGTMFFGGACIFFASRLLNSRQFLLAALCAAMISALVLAFLPPVASSKTISLVMTCGSVIALLAALDQLTQDRFRVIDRAAAFGDLSFSIYLLHFPLILVLVNGFIFLGLDRSLLSGSYVALAVFVLMTLWLSFWSLRWFEHPARRYFQRILGSWRNDQTKGKGHHSADSD